MSSSNSGFTSRIPGDRTYDRNQPLSSVRSPYAPLATRIPPPPRTASVYPSRGRPHGTLAEIPGDLSSSGTTSGVTSGATGLPGGQRYVPARYNENNRPPGFAAGTMPTQPANPQVPSPPMGTDHTTRARPVSLSQLPLMERAAAAQAQAQASIEDQMQRLDRMGIPRPPLSNAYGPGSTAAGTTRTWRAPPELQNRVSPKDVDELVDRTYGLAPAKLGFTRQDVEDLIRPSLGLGPARPGNVPSGSQDRSQPGSSPDSRSLDMITEPGGEKYGYRLPESSDYCYYDLLSRPGRTAAHHDTRHELLMEEAFHSMPRLIIPPGDPDDPRTQQAMDEVQCWLETGSLPASKSDAPTNDTPSDRYCLSFRTGKKDPPCYKIHSLPIDYARHFTNKDIVVYVSAECRNVVTELFPAIWEAWKSNRVRQTPFDQEPLKKPEIMEEGVKRARWATVPGALSGDFACASVKLMDEFMPMGELIMKHRQIMKRVKAVSGLMLVPGNPDAPEKLTKGMYAVKKGCEPAFIVVHKKWKQKGFQVVGKWSKVKEIEPSQKREEARKNWKEVKGIVDRCEDDKTDEGMWVTHTKMPAETISWAVLTGAKAKAEDPDDYPALAMTDAKQDAMRIRIEAFKRAIDARRQNSRV